MGNAVKGMNASKNTHKINAICPICKSKKQLSFPSSVINQAKQLTTISITKGIICEHHFQMFIDKNFKVRGYQKVDYEINALEEPISTGTTIKTENERELFDNLFLDGNYLEYKPRNAQNGEKEVLDRKELSFSQGEMTDEEIYEEFWDIINEDNVSFREFIEKDKRREKMEGYDLFNFFRT